MSSASTIITAISTALKAHASLTYITSWTEYQDELELEKAGIFPFINLDLQDFKIEEADNMNPRHMERRIYPVIILYAVRHENKAYVKSGDGYSFKGIFDIFDDIRTAVNADRTFGGAVNKVPWRPMFSSDVSKHINGSQWIGRAAIVFEVYKDVSLV